METMQLIPVLISAINEWNETEIPKTNYLKLRDLEDQLVQAIDLNHMTDSELTKTLTMIIYRWAESTELNTSYYQLRELEEELKDQITARESEIQRSKELRNAS